MVRASRITIFMSNPDTTPFFLAYNEVRHAAEVSDLHAKKADLIGALRAAAYGARKSQEAAMELKGLVGSPAALVVLERSPMSYVRELRALNDVMAANVKTADLNQQIADAELALKVIEDHADATPIWA